MTTKHTAPLRPVPGAVLPPPETYFLLEGRDGGPPTDGGMVVAPRERTFTYGGIHYVHVAEHADGRWIYRAMP